MAARLALVIALAALLGACTPAFRASGWDNRDPVNCLEPHDNGMWEGNFCRSGRGFLVWAVWRY